MSHINVGGLAAGFREHALLALELLTAATRTSQVQSNGYGMARPAPGILLRVFTDNGASTPSVTPSIQWRAPNGDYITIWTAAAAITTDTNTLYYVGPSADAADGGILEAVQIPMPGTWRLVLTRNTGSVDTLVDFCYVE